MSKCFILCVQISEAITPKAAPESLNSNAAFFIFQKSLKRALAHLERPKGSWNRASGSIWNSPKGSWNAPIGAPGTEPPAPWNAAGALGTPSGLLEQSLRLHGTRASAHGTPSGFWNHQEQTLRLSCPPIGAKEQFR